MDELQEWTGRQCRRGRGVPEAAFGPLPEDEDQSPIRDLGLAWGAAQARPGFEEENARADRVDDGGATRRRTGCMPRQALQRLLLTATHFGVQPSSMTQPFEELRQAAKTAAIGVAVARPWHIVIRLGCTPERHGSPHGANLEFRDMRTA